MKRSVKPSVPPNRVLFLDFDGVVHPTGEDLDDHSDACLATPFFGWVPLFASALEPHPDVGLVVDSTWRYNHKDEELRQLLWPLGARFLGVTPRGPRYESIQWWLHLNPRSSRIGFFATSRASSQSRRRRNSSSAIHIMVSDREVLGMLREWLLP